ncbi:hypothetical protein CHELA40_14658 [Chelatococcus asaccharovorans]|nr:hypothetical protein CHELA40_14658 [Chelatococcus asaccharovorans]
MIWLINPDAISPMKIVSVAALIAFSLEKLKYSVGE